MQPVHLAELHLADDRYFGSRTHADSVHWYHPDGSELTEGDWNAPSAQALVMEIIARENQEHWLVLFNASGYSINFELPEPLRGNQWQLAMDTVLHRVRVNSCHRIIYPAWLRPVVPMP